MTIKTRFTVYKISNTPELQYFYENLKNKAFLANFRLFVIFRYIIMI